MISSRLTQACLCGSRSPKRKRGQALMTKLLPPEDPADILCMASLINPFYVTWFLLALFASSSYSCCPPRLTVSLNVTFYLGKDRILGKELRKRNLQLRYEGVPDLKSLRSLDNQPNPSGTRSCLGSASSLTLTPPQPRQSLSLQSVDSPTPPPTQAQLCHLWPCQPALLPSLPHLHLSTVPWPSGNSRSPALSLSFPADWAQLLTVGKGQPWGSRESNPQQSNGLWAH